MNFLITPRVKPLASACTFAPDCNCFTNCGKLQICITPTGNKHTQSRAKNQE